MAEKSADKTKDKKIKALIGDLNSGDAKKVLSAIKSLRTNGDKSSLKPLVALLIDQQDGRISAEILELLSTLVDSSVIEEMMSIILDDDYLKIRQQLLTTFWNSKLDYSPYIADFVGIACEGDFMEALECLTIIENMEGPFQEQDLLEAQLHLKEYMEDKSPKDPQKAHIMSELALLIKDIDLDLDIDMDSY